MRWLAISVVQFSQLAQPYCTGTNRTISVQRKPGTDRYKQERSISRYVFFFFGNARSWILKCVSSRSITFDFSTSSSSDKASSSTSTSFSRHSPRALWRLNWLLLCAKSALKFRHRAHSTRKASVDTVTSSKRATARSKTDLIISCVLINNNLAKRICHEKPETSLTHSRTRNSN